MNQPLIDQGVASWVEAMQSPGIYTNVPRAAYNQLSHLNKSTLWSWWQNPSTYLSRQRKDPSDAMKWGILFEQLLLETTESEQMSGFAILTEAKKAEILAAANERQKGKKSSKFSRALTEYKEWAETLEQDGTTLISEWTLNQCKQAVRDLYQDPSIAALFQCGRKQQVVVVWQDPSTGIMCKGLVDVAFDGDSALTDIKTTASIVNASRGSAPYKFRNQARELGYHVQAHAYLTGWRLAQEQSGKRVEDHTRYHWRFIVGGVNATSLDSVTPPYPPAAWTLPPEDIAAAGEWWNAAIQEWQQCQASKVFPGLTTNEDFPELPRLTKATS